MKPNFIVLKEALTIKNQNAANTQWLI